MPHQEPARYDSTANERRLTTKDRSCDPVPAVVLDKATLTLEHIEEAGRIFDEIDGCESFETSR